MGRAAAVIFSYYPQDARPRREAEALVDAGMSVDVICLRLPAKAQSTGAFTVAGQPATEVVDDVRVFRLSVLRTQKGKLSYIAEYATFLFLAFVKLTFLHLRNRYEIVHVHNMPDFLVFAALAPKLCGSRIILDLHDPMPELYMTKFGLRSDSPVIRILHALERWSIRFADIVITPNLAFRDLFISRGCPEEKIHIIMNSPIEKIFNTVSVASSHEAVEKETPRFALMFHGGIFERHGIDTALRAVAFLRHEIPGLVLDVCGGGDYVDEFLTLVDEYDLKGVVNFHGFVSAEIIAEKIRSTDLGIIPNKSSPFTELNFPVRIFEYLSMGVPVVAPKTKGILDYFDDNSLFFFQPGSVESLIDTIRQVYLDPGRRRQVLESAAKVYNSHRWESQRRYFVTVATGMEGSEAVVPGTTPR